MAYSIEQVVKEFVTKERSLNNLYFVNNQSIMPELAYCVDFPRLEIILDGEQDIQWADSKGELVRQTLYANDILYISTRSWNKPSWSKKVTTLSILFGKQQLGLSLLSWDGNNFIPHSQCNAPRRGPRVGAFILQALSELATQQIKPNHNTANFLLSSLLSHTHDLLNFDIETPSATSSLFEAIRQYIDTHFKANLSREYLAGMFYISPNYLSHLFHKESKVGLNEYLTQVRLEHAKSLLKRFDLNVKEVALASGFNDSNYFCRVFRKKTERSPTEYRRQYHSKMHSKMHNR